MRHPKCMPQASGQHSRRQMTSALVVHLPLKVSVCKRTFIWIWGEADLVSGQQETRYFRKLFHITAVSWWLHDKAIHSAAAVELRAELGFSNLSYEQLYIRLCNFLLLHMETSTGILLDLALGLAEKHIEWLTQYSYKHFSSLSPEFISAFIAGYPLVCVHYQKSGLTWSGRGTSLQLCWTVAQLPNIGTCSS